jgi:N-acyl-D-amino-acid deacylase
VPMPPCCPERPDDDGRVQVMSGDLLVRGARVIDGTGAPWFLGDVRIGGGRIAAVGASLPAHDAVLVDAGGRYLAPGFIDAHCHDDLICLREPERAEKASQGVTTLVVGNCSFSLYPTAPRSAELLRQHFSGLLGETAAEEVFDSFVAYRDALHGRGTALNLVSLVGHAALRLAVMEYDRRPATAAETATMQAMLARQLADGAAGLSLGLVYPPSAYADEAELLALAGTVKAHGKILAAHIRSYEAGLGASTDEFLGILRSSGAPGLLSHLQSAGRPNWGNVPKTIDKLEAARRDGVDVSFDMYPYTAGSSYVLQLLPPEAQEGGLPALLAQLRDQGGREALRKAVEESSPDPNAAQSKIVLIGWGNVRISGTSNPNLKRFEGKSMDVAAAEEGITPFDLMVRCIEEDAGQTAIVMFQLDEDDLHAACTHRLHMFGSDGLPRPGTKPHPRAYGTFPRVAGRLRTEGWFSLEDAVRRMTSTAAQRFSLGDRGLVRPGMVADLVMFEDSIQDRATFDSPAELSAGVCHVWVAGEAIVADGRITGRRPGRVLGH